MSMKSVTFFCVTSTTSKLCADFCVKYRQFRKHKRTVAIALFSGLRRLGGLGDHDTPMWFDARKNEIEFLHSVEDIPCPK
jgi:hypothetical protein